jgi:hypothetical protein
LGYSRQQQVIGDDIIREAAFELRLVPREPGSTGTEPAPAQGSKAKSGRKMFKRFRLFS